MAKVYNADEVTLSIADALIESGFADGEFLSIVEDSDTFSDVVGSDGEVAVSRTNDQRATITVTVMQTSDGNDTLSALHALSRNQPGLAGAGPLYVRDRNGRSVYEAATCWIAKPPDVSYDRGATARAWKIRTDKLRRVDGGNDSA